MYHILKGQSEAVNPRKADNKIDKCTIYKSGNQKHKFWKGRQYNRQMYKILKGQSEVVSSKKADNTIDKILMGQSEAVNHRKADNTIDKCTRY